MHCQTLFLKSYRKSFDYGFVIGFSRLCVARSSGGFSTNSTKIYRYLAKSHREFKFSKIPLLASFFFIVTDNTKTQSL
jgi:hypothetical protein